MSLYDTGYDSTSKASIYKHSLKLIGKSLNDIISNNKLLELEDASATYGKKRKGHLGNLIEELYFGIKQNSVSCADFVDVGVELKTSPLKKHTKYKYVAKERLVFSMIDYMDIINETWETSSFLKKNRLLLILFYLFLPNVSITKYKFKIARLLDLLADLPSEDILTIKKDWEFIADKIKRGEAHKLSEGDTFYLGACTKAANAYIRRKQPNSNEPAKPRAFSFKQKYLNYIIQDTLKRKVVEMGSIYDNVDSDGHRKTIEELIQDKFMAYYNISNFEIEKLFDIKYDKRPKNHLQILTYAILGVKGKKKVAELEKADIKLKTINLEKSGVLKESMSFPIINYIEIINETWEDSTLRQFLSSQKFLFIVYQKQSDGSTILKKAMFWNIPYDDLESHVKSVWEETVERIKNGNAQNLPKISDNPVAHVRPHAQNSNDTRPTVYGIDVTKKCFWLNASYIRKQIKL